MKLIENEIWLEIEEITEGCNISDRTIRIGLERGSSLWQTLKEMREIAVNLQNALKQLK